MGSGKGGDRLAVALETEAGCQLIGDELEVGWFLKRQEIFEEDAGFWRPSGPMVTARECGGELRSFLEEAGAAPVEVGAADPKLERGLGTINQPLVELPEDMLEEQIGEPFGDLLFYSSKSTQRLSLGRGLSSAFATLRPPQTLHQGTVPDSSSSVPF